MSKRSNTSIAEMNKAELLQHLYYLGTEQECNSPETVAFVLQQVKEVRNRYKVVTGHNLTTDTPGLSIASVAVVHATLIP